MKVVIFLVLCSVTCLAVPAPREAASCAENNCAIKDNCRCSSVNNPVSGNDTAPQVLSEMKTATRRRARDVRYGHTGTGGGAPVKPLNDLEERLLNLISSVTVERADLMEAGVSAASSARTAPEVVTSQEAMVDVQARDITVPQLEVTDNATSGIELPQDLIAITVSESIVKTLYDNYLKNLFFARKNPDGKPIGLTFYVNHEYTDYSLVHDLYLRGYEIGVHSITKNSSQEYWRQATLDDLVQEFDGQKTIISNFANIPIKDIVGARTPQLQLEGDVSINAYTKAKLSYDNSWPTTAVRPMLPYTLNYKSTQQCLVTMGCPQESHPGFWVAPITNIKGKDGVECNSMASCLVEGTSKDIADWLTNEVERFRKGNRAPLVLRLDSFWFSFTANSYDGFVEFLNRMGQLKDVFLVPVKDVIEWVKKPVPVSQFKTTTPAGRNSTCSPVNCKSVFNDSERYMMSCVPCPEAYPWKGNPLGKKP